MPLDDQWAAEAGRARLADVGDEPDFFELEISHETWLPTGGGEARARAERPITPPRQALRTQFAEANENKRKAARLSETWGLPTAE